MKRQPKVAIMFGIFGPYIVARVNALAAYCEVVGIEGSEADDVYAWDKYVDADCFRRITLFTDAPISQKNFADVDAKVTAALDTIKPDVVAVPGWSAGYAHSMLLWALHHRIPAIVMSDSGKQDSDRPWWRELVKRGIVARFSAGLVGGQRHVDYLSSLGMPSERIFTGYDVVDNAHFGIGAGRARRQAATCRIELGLPERYFLASARFVEKKNLHRLIAAFAAYRAVAGSEAWNLVLLGDGNLRPHIEQQINHLGLGNAITMPGFKQYAELPAYYGLASAFVHASTSEQWGLVVNEAMASGLPVIVSNRCGCTPELVEDGENGFVFDPFDIGALAGMMSHVASPECDRVSMGEKSRKIVERWTPESFAQGLISAIQVALSVPQMRTHDVQYVLLRTITRLHARTM